MANQSPRIFPTSPDGSAAGIALPGGPLTLIDLTAQARFGIKGPGSASWLEAREFILPPVNRLATHRGIKLLRLGREDFLAVAASAHDALAELTAAWNAEAGQRGYWSWREEGWCWMRLSGSRTHEVMARLCALDLRPGHFADDEIAQTRVAHLEAVLVRAEGGFDIFFDIASTAYFIQTVAVASNLAGDETISRGAHQ
jgi:sarcosine oxidase, subunit gamma